MPVRLEKTVGGLEIEWSDGTLHRIGHFALRKACPCATCTEKHLAVGQRRKNELTVLASSEARPVEVLSMHPAGNYGYHIRFSDGHGSGIYTLELLRATGVAAGPV